MQMPRPARKQSHPAQPSGRLLSASGDNVAAHPTLREIPRCLFPLESDEANREYDELARILFDNDRMTVGTHRALCSYAKQFDSIVGAGKAKRVIRGTAFVQLDRARAALKIDDIEKRIAAPADAPENKFSHVGFAARRLRGV